MSQLIAELQKEEKQLLDHLKLVRGLLDFHVKEEKPVVKVKPEALRKVRRIHWSKECLKALRTSNKPLSAREVYNIICINNGPEFVVPFGIARVFTALNYLWTRNEIHVDQKQKFYHYYIPQSRCL